MTKWFRDYLMDFREHVLETTETEWLSGVLKHEVAEGNRSQANTLNEIATLEFVDIADFYQPPDQEELEGNAE